MVYNLHPSDCSNGTCPKCDDEPCNAVSYVKITNKNNQNLDDYKPSSFLQKELYNTYVHANSGPLDKGLCKDVPKFVEDMIHKFHPSANGTYMVHSDVFVHI